MIYIIIFLLLAALAVFDLIATPRIVREVLIWGVLISIIVVSAIRWEVGPDWDAYHSYYIDYENYRAGVYINMMEPGYTWIVGLIKSTGASYPMFLAIIAIITIGLKFQVIRRFSQAALIAIFFYYCYFLADIAAVRQFTAVSITLVASIFIVKRKPFIFTILVLIATSIHVASIAFLAAYWIYHRKLSNKFLILILGLSFILGLANVAGFMLDKIISLLGPASIYAEKLLKYNDAGLDSSKANPYLSFFLGALKRAMIFPLLFYYRKRVDSENSRMYAGFLNLLVAGNVIYFLFIISFPAITRLGVSFLFFEIFLLSIVVTSVKDLKLRLVIFSLLILFGALRLYTFMSPYLELYLPFKTSLN